MSLVTSATPVCRKEVKHPTFEGRDGDHFPCLTRLNCKQISAVMFYGGRLVRQFQKKLYYASSTSLLIATKCTWAGLKKSFFFSPKAALKDAIEIINT